MKKRAVQTRSERVLSKEVLLARLMLAVGLFALMSCFALADKTTIIDSKDYINGEVVNIDGLDFTVSFDPRNQAPNQISIYGDYLRTIVRAGQCRTIGYYEFCFEEFVHVIERHKATISVYKMDCIPYHGSLDLVCKIPLGRYCNLTEQCASAVCLHGICSEITSVCRDGYCDNEERSCPEDCINRLTVHTMIPLTFYVPVDRDRMDTGITLRPGVIYNFTAEGNYTIGKPYLDVTTEGTDRFSEFNPCPYERTGALVAFACDECYALASMQEFRVNRECNLSFQVNDVVLKDNNGSAYVSISEKIDKQTYLYTRRETSLYDLDANKEEYLKAALEKYLNLLAKHEYEAANNLVYASSLKELNEIRQEKRLEEIFDPQLIEILTASFDVESGTAQEHGENIILIAEVRRQRGSETTDHTFKAVFVKDDLYYSLVSLQIDQQNHSTEDLRSLLITGEEKHVDYDVKEPKSFSENIERVIEEIDPRTQSLILYSIIGMATFLLLFVLYRITVSLRKRRKVTRITDAEISRISEEIRKDEERKL